MAVTSQASNVTGKSATLNGTVDPDGATITECHFEYGPTTRYGESQPCSSTPSGSSPVAVSADIAGVAENTTYHFRLVAADSGGSKPLRRGLDETFTTLTSPLIDTAYTTNLTESSVDLKRKSTRWGSIRPTGSSGAPAQVTATVCPCRTRTSARGRAMCSSANISAASAQTRPITGGWWRPTRSAPPKARTTRSSTSPAMSSGVGCPNEQLRVQNALSLLLPDCRAYEQVSPVDKNESDVKNDLEGDLLQQAAVNGERVFYESMAPSPGRRRET